MPRLAAAMLAVPIVATVILAAPLARANEFCDKELGPMMEQRKVLTSKLAVIAKSPKAANARQNFCGTLNAYIGNIQKFLKYMEQNKEFCGVPDEVIDSAKKGLTQNQSMRRKVCVAQAQPPQQQQSAPGKPAIARPPVELRLQ